MPLPILPTTLVGSYAQPDWLIDRKNLAGRFPPRVRAKELWRVAPDFLEQAQDDATLLAIHDQERAGLDIITDGEMRRESYSNRFATALDGIDADKPGYASYYEAALPLLAPRGFIAADNTLWSGQVLDPEPSDANTAALKAFNDLVANDPRVTCVMLTVRDGLTLIRRRPD